MFCTIFRRSLRPRSASSDSPSYALSKWSSIARLPRPVTKIISVMPAATASSTAYWISGLSTMGSISFGLAFVAGRESGSISPTRKHRLGDSRHRSGLLAQQFQQPLLVEQGDSELARLVVLGSRIGSGHHVV